MATGLSSCRGAVSVREGWGAPASFDQTAVPSVQFAEGASIGFDYWIDDVGFY
jgi:hypothetical protein